MSYYYEIVEKNVALVEGTMTPHESASDALGAAKDSLVTKYVDEWPVFVRIYDLPPSDPQCILLMTHVVWPEDVKKQEVDRNWVVTFSGSVSVLAKTAEEAIEKAKRVEAGAAGYGFRAGDF